MSTLRVLRNLLLGGCAVIALHACFEVNNPPHLNFDPPDAGGGEPESDAGEDAGVVVDAGQRPKDIVFAIGVTNNSGSIPQSAPIVALMFEEGTAGPETVVAKRVASPITVDGNPTEWISLPESEVPLQSRGGAIGMTQSEWDTEWMLANGRTTLYDFGITSVRVKAAYDDNNIYFLLSWADATEHRNRDGWYVDGGTWLRISENEDRAYLGFDIDAGTPAFQAVGCSGACHIRERLGDVSDAGRAYRFRMHTDAPGEMLDYWQWRASTTNPMGAADDGYIDETSRKTDSMTDWAAQNAGRIDGGPMQPLFMSEDGINANPSVLYRPDAGGKPVAVPFDPADAGPDARLPGWIAQRASPNRDDVKASGRYIDGRWWVEFSRALTNSDSKDVQFLPR